MDQFPDYPDLAADPARQKLTLRHALTMTLGTERDELSIPYTDPRNSEIAMDRAPDRFRYILERRVVGEPGERWTYCGGAAALLARLIVRGTGQTLEDYAQSALFTPLSIAHAEWDRDKRGEPIAASGLRITPRSLARIGVMALAGGKWDGRQVVPADWLTASFTAAVSIPDGRRFGQHWYLGAVNRDDGSGGVRWEPAITAIGNGGQRLFLLPDLDLVVVVTAGNYDVFGHWQPPLVVVRDVLLPALRS
jgi:CubicO group peptidase (beta-lactamase class C family)